MCAIVELRLTVHSAMYSYSGLEKGCFYMSLMHQYFMGQPLPFSACLQRFCIEWTSWRGGHVWQHGSRRQWATRSALAC